jgi:hypothetical protein
MALSLEDFRTRFPEFTATDDDYVSAKLAEALRGMDADVWGDLADDGQGYLTAHLMALSPFGNAAKLVKGDTTTYEGHYRRLLRAVAAGHRSI